MTQLRIAIRPASPEAYEWYDPREEGTGNVGRFVSFHRQMHSELPVDEPPGGFGGWASHMTGVFKQYPGCAYVPVFRYEHSGVRLSTDSFYGRAPHAEWDSGLAGLLVAPLDVIRECYGVSRVTAKVRARAVEDLKQEIETWDDWISGQLYEVGTERFEEDLDGWIEIDDEFPVMVFGYTHAQQAAREEAARVSGLVGFGVEVEEVYD
jgi:hypothetical protein